MAIKITAQNVQDVRANVVHVMQTQIKDQLFDAYPALKSVGLYVAQYWDDEADDAVHGILVVSELPEPILKNAKGYLCDDINKINKDDVNLPTIKQFKQVMYTYSYDEYSVRSVLDFLNWDSNGQAIPLWAAWCPENGSQDASAQDNYALALTFYRDGTSRFASQLRPWLDGVSGSYDSDEGETSEE